MHLKGNFIGFNLLYWTPTCGKYFLEGSIFEKCGKMWKNGRFPAATAGLGKYCTSGYGRIGIYRVKVVGDNCIRIVTASSVHVFDFAISV